MSGNRNIRHLNRRTLSSSFDDSDSGDLSEIHVPLPATVKDQLFEDARKLDGGLKSPLLPNIINNKPDVYGLKGSDLHKKVKKWLSNSKSRLSEESIPSSFARTDTAIDRTRNSSTKMTTSAISDVDLLFLKKFCSDYDWQHKYSRIGKLIVSNREISMTATFDSINRIVFIYTRLDMPPTLSLPAYRFNIQICRKLRSRAIT
jgi:hypothetical protein